MLYWIINLHYLLSLYAGEWESELLSHRDQFCLNIETLSTFNMDTWRNIICETENVEELHRSPLNDSIKVSGLSCVADLQAEMVKSVIFLPTLPHLHIFQDQKRARQQWVSEDTLSGDMHNHKGLGIVLKFLQNFSPSNWNRTKLSNAPVELCLWEQKS